MRANTPKTVTKTTASPNAYMPLDACASGPLVLATRKATAAHAMRRAAMYPPATTATLRNGFMAFSAGRLTGVKDELRRELARLVRQHEARETPALARATGWPF